MVYTSTVTGKKRPLPDEEEHFLDVNNQGDIVASYGNGSPAGRISTQNEVRRRGASRHFARRVLYQGRKPTVKKSLQFV